MINKNKDKNNDLKNGAIAQQMRRNIEQAQRLLAEKRAREAEKKNQQNIQAETKSIKTNLDDQKK